MDRGEVVEQGTAEKVADEYLKRAHARGNERLRCLAEEASEYPRWGSGEIETGAVELFGAGDEPTLVFRPGEPFRVRIRYTVRERCAEPVFGIGLYRSDGTYVNGANHHWREDPIRLGALEPGEQGAVEMAFERLPLLTGQYYLTVFVYDHSKAAPTPVDHREHAATFEVVDADVLQHGLLFLPSRWSVTRRGPGGEERREVSES